MHDRHLALKTASIQMMNLIDPNHLQARPTFLLVTDIDHVGGHPRCCFLSVRPFQSLHISPLMIPTKKTKA